MQEVFCSHCQGMVNGNGCAQEGCPVKAGNPAVVIEKLKADHDALQSRVTALEAPKA